MDNVYQNNSSKAYFIRVNVTIRIYYLINLTVIIRTVLITLYITFDINNANEDSN